jgi:hypothetical protein
MLPLLFLSMSHQLLQLLLVRLQLRKVHSRRLLALCMPRLLLLVFLLVLKLQLEQQLLQ